MKRKMGMSDRIFTASIMLVLALLCIVVIYPIYYMLIVSISDGYAVLRGEISFLPKGINFSAYEAILSNKYVPNSYKNTIVYTVTGTLINLTMTSLCAYPCPERISTGETFLPRSSFSPCFSTRESFPSIWWSLPST